MSKLGFRNSQLIGLAALLAATLLLTLWPLSSTFQVVLQTEFLQFSTVAGQKSPWIFRDAAMFEGNSNRGATFSGKLELSDGVDVSVQRISSGPFKARLRSNAPNGSVGILWSADEQTQHVLSERVVIIIEGIPDRAKQGQNIVLPITGYVRFGRKLGHENQPEVPLLRSGSVTLVGRTILGGKRFSGPSYSLQTGDEISLDYQSAAWGALVADERAGMTAVFRAQAADGRVIRFGGSGYRIGMSVFDRLRNDSLLQGLWASFIFLLGITKIMGAGKT